MRMRNYKMEFEEEESSTSCSGASANPACSWSARDCEMSDGCHPQELRKIKVSEPSLTYAAKSTKREILFALDIPYSFLKNWYNVVKNVKSTESEGSKYPYVLLLERSIPECHFCFSSEDNVRREINESLRRNATIVTQMYRSTRGGAGKIKLHEKNKRFHVFTCQTTRTCIDKLKDEVELWKNKCEDLERKGSELFKVIQAVVKDSNEKEKVIDELRTNNSELVNYVKQLENAHESDYHGKPLHEPGTIRSELLDN